MTTHEYGCIRFKNFLAVGNNFTTINLNSKEIQLIIGTNGTGKSTFIDALTFVLFDQAFRDTNKPLLVNTVNGKDCLVELELKINDVPYLVRRGIKPNIFEVWKDGMQLLTEIVSIDDQQKHFETHILGMNFKTFKQIVVISSTDYVPFLKLPAAARRQFMEDILQLRVFSSMNIHAKKESQTLYEDLRTNGYSIDVTKNAINSFEKLAEQARKNVTEVVAHLEKTNETLREQLQQLEKDTSALATDRSQIGFPADKLYLLKKQRQEVVDSLYSLKAKNKETTKQKDFWANNDVCPTCSQALTVDLKQAQLRKVNENIERTNSSINVLDDGVRHFDKKIEEQRLIVEADESLEKQINENLAQIRLLKGQIKLNSDSIKTMTAKSNSANEEELLKYYKELEGFEWAKEQLMNSYQLSDTIIQLLKDDGIKSHIIKHTIPRINDYIQKYLTLLDFYIGFEFDENFNETIKARHRDKLKYGSFSEGEKDRIDLAIMFAWRDLARDRNSVKTNLLILDEAFDGSLDLAGVDVLYEHLEMSKTSVIIISHKESYIDKIPNCIRFEKIGNFSVMKEQ